MFLRPGALEGSGWINGFDFLHFVSKEENIFTFFL